MATGVCARSPSALRFQATVSEMGEARSSVLLLFDLRCAVAATGEAHKWWRSTFLSTIGFSFLQRVYPRTFVAAAVRSASEAARLEHDARIGRGQVVHLFRLPIALERAIDDALRGMDASAQAERREVLIASQGPLNLLRRLAAGRKLNGGVEGPIACGPAARLHEQSATSLLAAQYLAGFEAGRQVYPYFDLVSSR